MLISCIITSNNNKQALESMLTQIENQKLVDYEMIAVVSDYSHEDLEELDIFERCETVVIQDHKNDWGHEKRAMGLELALGDYVAFFNDDDTYSSKYLRKLSELALSSDADIVACDFASHLIPQGLAITAPVIGRITSGNFMVRRTPAQEVGYKHRTYEADGKFIEDMISAGASFARVPEVLYVHN